MAIPQKLSLQFFSIFWLLGLVITYWPGWLQDRGLQSSEIGLVLASAFWFKVPMSLFMGGLADRTGRRKPLLLFIAVTVVVTLPAFYFGNNFLLYFVLWSIAGSAITAAIPLTDSLAISLRKRGLLSYGRVRLWGSVGFIVAALAGGQLLTVFGMQYTLGFMVAGSILLLFSTFLLPDTQQKPRISKQLAITELLSHREFVLFLCVAGLTQSSHALLYGFASIHWRDAGLSESAIGWLWAEGVIAEVFVFYFAARFTARLGPWRLLMIGSFAATIRWIGFTQTTDLPTLMLLQVLHACSFAMTHLGIIEFVSGKIPENLSTSAQTITDSFAQGILFGISMMLAGVLYGQYSGQSWYVMSIMALVACILGFIGYKHFPGQLIEK